MASAISSILFASDLVARYHALAPLPQVGRFAGEPDSPNTWTNPRVVNTAVSYLETKQVMTPAEFQALQDQYRSIGFSVAGVENKALLGKMRDSLAESVALGDSSERAAERLQQTLTEAGYTRLDPWHAQLVSTMASSNAYARGTWDSLMDPRIWKIVPYLRYLTRADSRVRPTHAAMHNHFAPRTDPIWRTWWPPCGFNCRCVVVGVSVQTVETYDIQPDPWPRDPENKSRRVKPDPGFGGPPTPKINAASGSSATQAVRQTKRDARAGRTQPGPLGSPHDVPPPPGRKRQGP